MNRPLMLEDHGPALAKIWAERRARTWAGMVAFFGILASLLMNLAAPRGPMPARMFLALWPMVLGVYAVVRLVRPSLSKGDAFWALARAHDRSFKSVAWPLVGSAVLMPLSIHFVVFVLIQGGSAFGARSLREFSGWMGMSSLLVLLGYVVLCLMSVWFARELVGPMGRRDMGAKEGSKALVYSMLASCIPGVVAFGIPPLLVGLTGLFFVPLCFQGISRLFWREQDRMVEVESALVERSKEESFEACRTLSLNTEVGLGRRLSAFRFLVRNFERSRVSPVVDTLLSEGERELSVLALKTALKFTHRPNKEVLVGLAKRNDPLLTPMAIKLIVLSDARNAESALLELLQHSAMLSRRESVEALGRVGTRRAIAPLRAMLNDNVRDQVLRVVADDAIKRIHQRMGPKPVGALSMVEPQDDGALSMFEDKEGQLSEV